VDEYQLEIQTLNAQLEHLRETEADLALIDEYEAEVRNLSALYRAASETYSAGAHNRRMAAALTVLGFGDWSMVNVYSFVYDLSMDLPLDGGRDLSTMIDETDYAGSLLEALDERN
jgi:hypothetical protein